MPESLFDPRHTLFGAASGRRACRRSAAFDRLNRCAFGRCRDGAPRDGLLLLRVQILVRLPEKFVRRVVKPCLDARLRRAVHFLLEHVADVA
jgi:hypothetical protein